MIEATQQLMFFRNLGFTPEEGPKQFGILMEAFE